MSHLNDLANAEIAELKAEIAERNDGWAQIQKQLVESLLWVGLKAVVREDGRWVVRQIGMQQQDQRQAEFERLTAEAAELKAKVAESKAHAERNWKEKMSARERINELKANVKVLEAACRRCADDIKSATSDWSDRKFNMRDRGGEGLFNRMTHAEYRLRVALEERGKQESGQ